MPQSLPSPSPLRPELSRGLHETVHFLAGSTDSVGRTFLRLSDVPVETTACQADESLRHAQAPAPRYQRKQRTLSRRIPSCAIAELWPTPNSTHSRLPCREFLYPC